MPLSAQQTSLPLFQEDPEILFRKGLEASRRNDKAVALSFLEKAAERAPQRADIAYNHGVLLQQLGFLNEAAKSWERAARLAPEHEPVWVNLALAQGLSCHPEQAFETYEKALRFHPQSRELLYNKANLHLKLGQAEESLALYRRLLAETPSDFRCLINAGRAFRALFLWEDADLFYQKALALAPKAFHPVIHFNRANLLLLQEKWEEGFAAYEWRLKAPGALPPPWSLPPLTRIAPAGTRILLWSDQGLGDALMFLRFAPLLAEKGVDLFLFAQTPLVPLLRGMPWVKGVFSPFDKPEPMDACLALGSLPFFLKVPPFAPPPAFLGFPVPTHKPTGKPRRIGLVWAGNPAHENDRHRSLTLNALAPLFERTDIEWVSLQIGAPAQERAHSPFGNRVLDKGSDLQNFAQTAKELARLDLLITVDTAAAHLAGSMGLPVWTLLPAFNGDWRWGVSGATSVWYPSMRLFRQREKGDWASVIQDVTLALNR